MLDSDKLSRIHEGLLAAKPGKTHSALYQAYPKVRGFSGRELDVDRFCATFVLGIAQTYPLGGKTFHSVALLVSTHAEDWAIEQMRETVKAIFARLKAEQRLPAAQVIGQALDKLLMGSRALQIEEPSRWVAFGFDQSDPIPDWMRSGLL